MKVVILYRPYSEHGRQTEEYIREFKSRNANERVEMVDIDSRDGSATASLYDILQYPAILVLRQDGALQKAWVGDQFPLIDEIASYARP